MLRRLEAVARPDLAAHLPELIRRTHELRQLSGRPECWQLCSSTPADGRPAPCGAELLLDGTPDALRRFDDGDEDFVQSKPGSNPAQSKTKKAPVPMLLHHDGYIAERIDAHLYMLACRDDPIDVTGTLSMMLAAPPHLRPCARLPGPNPSTLS